MDCVYLQNGTQLPWTFNQEVGRFFHSYIYVQNYLSDPPGLGFVPLGVPPPVGLQVPSTSVTQFTEPSLQKQL